MNKVYCITIFYTVVTVIRRVVNESKSTIESADRFFPAVVQLLSGSNK